VPKAITILDSVWAMKRKRKIRTKGISKHRARLNGNCKHQEYSKDKGCAV